MELWDLIVLAAALAAVVLGAAWVVVRLGGNDMPEEEFRRTVERSEALAALPDDRDDAGDQGEADEFEQYVGEAIDALPEDLREVLAEIPIVVSTRGREYHAYGHYIGDTVARDYYHDRIVIYRDTLERDFGHDPELLRAEVARTVRHEVAHHLGWDEDGVRGLGL